MRITAGTLFLAFAVLLDSIELICAIETTLAKLFSGYSYNRIMPPIDTYPAYELERFKNWPKLGNRNIESAEGMSFMARGPIIIGYSTQWYFIKPLCTLFHQENVYIVFDTTKDRWDTLAPWEFAKLGVGRYMHLVQAHEEAAAANNLSSGKPIQIRAHKLASELAHSEADRIERDLAKKIATRELTIEWIENEIKSTYSHTYYKEFYDYLQKNEGRPVKYVYL